ncbi:MAG: phosphate regulon transcriptional regulator PhoB [Candidatus Polarisedimenticolaceae bacterium]|nr:phosphate regulon transcriptional regulator PhoB [Candidatus Polarisedimenticolaceae bacterium]
MSNKILVVDDEPVIRELIRLALETAGFQVSEAGHAEEARKVLQQESPDLLLLDWMLPGRSGLELARELKRNSATRSMPIIMLTAKGEERDKVEALDVGADDYITKPFSPREMTARIRAVLRRTMPIDSSANIEIDGLLIEPDRHQLSINGKTVEIAPTEYRLLHFFATHPDRAYSRSQLLDQVWGDDVYLEERTVDVHIRRLRKQLEASGHDKLIQTVRGIGYCFSQK